VSVGGNEINLTLRIEGAGDDFDADELNQLAHSLMRSLEDVGVESVTVVRDQRISLGAKGDPFTLGALLVAVLPATLPKVMEFLQAWTGRNKDYTLRAKVQRGDQSAEIEYPANMPPDELKKHVDVLKHLVEE
jgi:hypothetical protein